MRTPIAPSPSLPHLRWERGQDACLGCFNAEAAAVPSPALAGEG
ncbi:hypothetical protein [Azospirillum largimobile]